MSTFWARFRAAAVVISVACVPVVLPPQPASAAPTCGAATVTLVRNSGPVLYFEPSSTPALNSGYAMFKVTNTSGAPYSDLWVTLGSFAGPKIGLGATESGSAHIGALAAGASANAAYFITASGLTTGPEAHTVSVYTTRPDLAAGTLCTSSYTMTTEDDISAGTNTVNSVTVSPNPQLGGTATITVNGSTGNIGAAGLFTSAPASYSTWPANVFRLIGSTITLDGVGTYTDTLYKSALPSSATDYTAQFVFAVVGTTASSTPVSPMSHISSGNQVKHTSTTNFGSLPPIPPVGNYTSLAMAANPTTLTPAGGTVTFTTTVTNTAGAAVTLDDLTVTLPAGTSYVSGSSTFAGSGVANPTISGSTATYLSGLTVPANSSRTLTLQVTVPAVAATYSASVIGHVATVTIDSTTGTADSQPATASTTVAALPAVSSISPLNGTSLGGTVLTITGTGFTGATAVTVGGNPATSVSVTNSTTIQATTPAGTGAVHVRVTTPGGTSATGPSDVFTYDPLPNPPTPPNLTSSGTGTAPQTATVTIPSGGSATLLSGGSPTAGPVVVNGQGSYALSGTTITFTPVFPYAGTATAVAYRVTDAYAQSGSATYTPTVNPPAGPAPGGRTSTGVGTAPQSVTISLPTSGSVSLLSGGSPTAGPVVVNGQGSYTISGATITFTPVLGYAGTATAVGYRVTDAYGQTGDALYTPTVTAPAGPAPGGETSTGVGTAPQSVTISLPTSGSVSLLSGGSPTAGPVVVNGQGTYTISGNTITFTAVFGYAGTATAVGYRVTDAYGQTGDALYTPTVTAPAGPAPAGETSTGVGTAPQQVTITAPQGGSVAMLSGGSPTAGPVVVGGQGTYTISGNTITFTAVFGYAGTATGVGYRLTDAYGQTGDALYRPTVTPPAGPAPAGETSNGVGTAPQQVTITAPQGGSVSLLDENGATTAGPVVVPGEGSYSISGNTVTFTPVLGFAGTATGVGYRLTDAYGQPGDAIYAPSVTPPAGPAPGAETSNGIGTAPQQVTVTVPAGGSVLLIDGNQSTTPGPVVVPGEGSYALAGGVITFTAVAAYSGTATPVVFRVTDAYGQTGDATYTPTVIAAQAPPPAPVDLTSSGVGTAPQQATITMPAGGSASLLDVNGAPSADPVVVPGEGSYALSGATITFTPVLGFAGTATPLGYRVADSDGQTGDAIYTSTVTAPAGPAPGGETSTGVGIAPQSVTVTLPSGGSVSLLSAGSPTAGPVVVSGQGSYSISGATITFTPVLGYTGNATPVGFRLTDAYAQTGDALYTPAVTAPAGPAPGGETSTGVGIAPQSVTVTLPSGGSVSLLSAGSPTAGPVVVSGQGSYSISGATITFTPVFGYAGTATPVGFRVTDAYGQTGDATYTPTVTAPTGPAPTGETSTGVGTAPQQVTITLPSGGSVSLLSGGSPTAGPVVVPGEGSYSISGNTVTFTPVLGFAGTATGVGYRLTDAYGQTGDALYTPTVTAPAGPAPGGETSTGVGIAPQSVTVTLPSGGSVSLLSAGFPTAGPVVVSGQGSYTISGATITFTPVFGYAGTATPVGFRLTDAYAQTGDALYTPTVTAPAGPAPGGETSTGVGTAPQSVTITAPQSGSVSLLSAGSPTPGPVVVSGQGSYTISGNTITFTAVFGYAGTATPVGFRVTDAYGQTGDALYTPTVTAPTGPAPTGETSTGVGTAPQSVTITAPQSGSVSLLSGGSPTPGPVVVNGQGSYTISGNTITFTAVFGYAGTATPVGFRVTDAYGQTGDSTYTPTVTAPTGPAPGAQTSTGTGTAPQSVTITAPQSGSVSLLSAGSPTAGPVVVSGQGSYTISGATITFTAVFGYAGTATPVGFRVTDAYGQTGDALYTPTVTAPTGPAPAGETSTGVGIAPQSVTVTLPQSGSVLLLSAGTPTAGPVVVSGQGSYTISGNTITFTAVFGYAGTATPVGFRVTDAYGQTGDSTYTPTVTAPTGPAPAGETSTGVGTAPQQVTITPPSGGSVSLLSGGSPTPGPVVVNGQGSYTISGNTITFTAVYGYAGTATPVGFRVTDAYGQTGDQTYQPTVTAPAPPSAVARTSSGVGPLVQSVSVTVPAGGTLTVLDGQVPVTDLTIVGTGTFHAGTGELTFTPGDAFAGVATATYRITDAYGQAASASYAATVTAPPPPAPTNQVTTGVGTTVQNVQVPVPDRGTITLLDGNGNPVTSLLIPGKGTYTLTFTPVDEAAMVLDVLRVEAAAVATLTFTPVLGYTGQAPPVQYQITDSYGQAATATYTPTVTPPAGPPAAPQTTVGNQTDPQHVSLTIPAGGSIILLDQGGNPTTTVTIPGQGTYTLDADTGELTFTPLPDFTGTPDPVTYRVTDAYGQSATATYTPAVTGGAGGLPVTGPAAVVLAELGLLTVLAGAWMLRSSLRRRRQT